MQYNIWRKDCYTYYLFWLLEVYASCITATADLRSTLCFNTFLVKCTQPTVDNHASGSDSYLNILRIIAMKEVERERKRSSAVLLPVPASLKATTQVRMSQQASIGGIALAIAKEALFSTMRVISPRKIWRVHASHDDRIRCSGVASATQERSGEGQTAVTGQCGSQLL